MSSDSSEIGKTLGNVCDSFIARLRRGEGPTLQEYLDRYPRLAEPIRELLPTLIELERVGPLEIHWVEPPDNNSDSTLKTKAVLTLDPAEESTKSDAEVQAIANANANPNAETNACFSKDASNDNGNDSNDENKIAGNSNSGDNFNTKDRSRRLGDYRILRRVGVGGMGVVYEAVRESLKCHVALKVIHPRYRADTQYLRRFQTEARSAAALHHTNIVSVFDYGEQDGVCYYAMQFIHGRGLDLVLEDVRRLRHPEEEGRPQLIHDATTEAPPTIDSQVGAVRDLSRGLLTGRFADPAKKAKPDHNNTDTKTLNVPETSSELTFDLDPEPDLGPEPEILYQSQGSGSGSGILDQSLSLVNHTETRYYREIARIGAQVADALAYAHRRRVLHRDIKPSNLLLDAMGNVWITDFGLAKVEETNEAKAELAQSQDVVGTLRFMSAERLKGMSNRRCDIYSLGTTLYELLAMRPAFDGEGQVRVIEQINAGKPAPLRQIDHRIPKDLETIVLKAMAKEPQDRFASAADMADDLRRFLEGRPIRSRPIPIYEQIWRWVRRNPWLSLANALAAASTIAIAVISTLAAHTLREQRDALWEQERENKMYLSRLWKIEDDLQEQLARSEEAERRSRRELGRALLDAGIALQNSGRIGQRFASLDRLKRASNVLQDDFESLELLAEIDRLIEASESLTDLRLLWEREVEPCFDLACNRSLDRYAVVLQETGETVVRQFNDDQELFRIPCPEDCEAKGSVEWSPDGRHLTLARLRVENEDNGNVENRVRVELWNLEATPKVVCRLNLPSNAQGFHPDGRQWLCLANGENLDGDGDGDGDGDNRSEEAGIAVWDLEEGKPLRTLPVDGPVQALAVDPQGKRLAVTINPVDAPSRLQVLSLAFGREIASWNFRVGGHHPTWSPDGRYLVCGDDDGRLYLRDMRRHILVSVLRSHDSVTTACQFSPDGQFLVTSDLGGQTRIWDLESRNPMLVAWGKLAGSSLEGNRLVFQQSPSTLSAWELVIPSQDR